MTRETLKRLDSFKSKITEFSHTIGEIKDFKFLDDSGTLEFYCISVTGIHFSLRNFDEKIYLKWDDREFLYPYGELKDSNAVHRILLSTETSWKYLLEFLEFLYSSMKVFDEEKIYIPYLQKIKLMADIHDIVNALDASGKNRQAKKIMLAYAKYI